MQRCGRRRTRLGGGARGGGRVTRLQRRDDCGDETLPPRGPAARRLRSMGDRIGNVSDESASTQRPTGALLQAGSRRDGLSCSGRLAVALSGTTKYQELGGDISRAHLRNFRACGQERLKDRPALCFRNSLTGKRNRHSTKKDVNERSSLTF